MEAWLPFDGVAITGISARARAAEIIPGRRTGTRQHRVSALYQHPFFSVCPLA
jgi:hypothetical protein